MFAARAAAVVGAGGRLERSIGPTVRVLQTKGAAKRKDFRASRRHRVRIVDIIRAKRDGETLSRAAIDSFVAGVTDGSWADYQIAALLMAIVLRGMTLEETTWLTDAMVRSGARVDLSSVPGAKVGKHSTGGVGDKISIVLAPVVAACGVIVPKMSGRGLGHTGGTIDKLEAIPGFRTSLGVDEFRSVLRSVGCSIIGQSADVAPADKKLYALRDVTATVDSIPLIAASVMSKKLAEGSDALVLDVKCGRGAFMKRREDAVALARTLVAIGTARGLRTEAFITNMDTPLGCAVGNALEIAECIEALHGRGPADLMALVVRLATRMVQIGRGVEEEAADAEVRAALASGAALSKFREMVVHQGGDAAIVERPDALPRARALAMINAKADGYLARLDAEAVGRAALVLGAGRTRAGEAIDPAVGVRILRARGERVRRGDPVLELHYNDEARASDARPIAEAAIEVSDTAPPAASIVLGWVHAGGEVSYA